MFFTPENKTPETKTASPNKKASRATRAAAAGLDIAIDFATLGEYRIVTDAVADETETTANSVWASGIEWSAPERTRATCSLPRARNRDWARSRIRD